MSAAGRLLFLLPTFVTLWLMAPPTAAQEPAVRLEYEAPEDLGCPGAAAFTDRVEARLGRPPFSDSAEGDRVEVRVRSAPPDEVAGRIRWLGPDEAVLGERALRAAQDRCDELAESLAVALAILLEDPPERPPAPPPPVTTPEPPVVQVVAPSPAEPEPERQLEPEPEPEPELDQEVPTWLELSAGIHGGIGWTPGLSVGGRITAGALWREGSLHVEAGLDVQPTAEAVADGGIVEAVHYTLGLGGCLRMDILSACLVVGGGALQATVQTVADPSARTSGTLFVAVRGGVDADITEWLSIAPEVEVAALPIRSAVAVDDEILWESSPVVGRLSLTLRLHLR